MKEFEKWERQLPKRERECRPPDFYEGIAKGWITALEWALTNKKPIKYNDYKFDYINLYN